jgi:hypothetical protein
MAVSNQTVAWMAGPICVGIAADVALNSGDASVFLILKLFDLMEYLMVWR